LEKDVLKLLKEFNDSLKDKKPKKQTITKPIKPTLKVSPKKQTKTRTVKKPSKYDD